MQSRNEQNMGSGASKTHPVLQCPKGYDADSFKKICKLFDELDSDSNFGVSSDELTSIAKLHVENCQTTLKKRIEAKTKQLEFDLNDLDEDTKQRIAEIQATSDRKKDHLKKVHASWLQRIKGKIDWYANLDEDGREQAFMKVLKPRDSQHVDFWTFFEYMKNRTGDIKNIKE